jgi:hypothetical protein
MHRCVPIDRDDSFWRAGQFKGDQEKRRISEMSGGVAMIGGLCCVVVSQSVSKSVSQ